MVRKALQVGEPKLKEKCVEIKEVTSEIKQVVTDLFDTLESERLVGIAAPQIGSSIRLFVSSLKRFPNGKDKVIYEDKVYINPKITFQSEETCEIFEGCGSVAYRDLFAPVTRSKKVIVEAFDMDMKKFSIECDGLLARVILHEYDHLENIEFLSRITNFDLVMAGEHFREYGKKHPEIWKTGDISVYKFTQL